jgi:hypothetical protein
MKIYFCLPLIKEMSFKKAESISLLTTLIDKGILKHEQYTMNENVKTMRSDLQYALRRLKYDG